MSNRNFDSRVITQRLQNQVNARNLYLNNTNGKGIINNPQNSDGNASRFNSYIPGAQTEYFRGLVGAGETISPGGIIGIPPFPQLNQNLTPSPLPPPQVPGSMSFNYRSPSRVKYTNNNDLTIGTQSFTIEWYQYWQEGASYPRVFSIGTFPDAYIALSYEQGNTYLWLNESNTAYGTINTVPLQNSWSHVAIVGTSGVGIKIYFNGNEEGYIPGAYNITNDTIQELAIGNETAPIDIDYGYTGLITNFRWVNGTAIYTTNFSPPSVPLTNVSGTQVLLLVSGETNLVLDSSNANRTPITQNVIYSSSLPQPVSILTYSTVGTVSWTVPSGVTSIEYLIVGGGGGSGGGYDTGGGGGGGGGMVLTGTISVIPGNTYTIVVGDGGAGGITDRTVPTETNGSSGGNSSFDSIIALGGSGGFASRLPLGGNNSSGGPGATNPNAASEGGRGGGSAGDGNGAGGGGGGSSGNGSNGVSNTGGNGGNGTSSSISGSTTIYGMGGRGANGASTNAAVAGALNTGNGARGGGGGAGNEANGAKGGSGIVIIKG